MHICTLRDAITLRPSTWRQCYVASKQSISWASHTPLAHRRVCMWVGQMSPEVQDCWYHFFNSRSELLSQDRHPIVWFVWEGGSQFGALGGFRTSRLFLRCRHPRQCAYLAVGGGCNSSPHGSVSTRARTSHLGTVSDVWPAVLPRSAPPDLLSWRDACRWPVNIDF